MAYFLAMLVGLAAGLLGGLAGVGGSILILPALALLFGTEPDPVQHLYMATAMSVNVVVAIPAALRHRKAGAMRTDLIKVMLPTTALFLALGVFASNSFRGWQLQLILAGFLVLYCVFNIRAIITSASDTSSRPEATGAVRVFICSAIAGGVSGLLGLGGGVIHVPLLQLVCRVPLRQAIATSSAVMCLTAIIGATLKLWSLPSIYTKAGIESAAPVSQALLLALCMAPTAIVGARFGAALTHKLPLAWVRIVITIMLFAAAATLARKGWAASG